MLEKITRREFIKKSIKKGILYVSGGSLLFNCSSPTQPDTTPPIAKINTDKVFGYSPLTINFDGSSSTDNKGITDYSWNFGDGKTSIGKIVSHTYEKNYGKFTAELTVKDAASNTSKSTIDIYVNELTPNLLPSEYYGKVNNGNVPDNLVVEGFINNNKYSQPSKTKNGYYNIIILPDNLGTYNIIEGGKEGDKIQIKIDGKDASPLLDFKRGSNIFDLTY